MTTIIKGSTKRGKKFIETGKQNFGYYLGDVYGKCSNEKIRAYNWCFNKYMESEYSTDFHICSYNNFAFSVAWNGIFTMHDGTEEDAMFIETANNSYVILLNK